MKLVKTLLLLPLLFLVFAVLLGVSTVINWDEQ